MELIKLDLISKNNVQRGTYHYIPIVKIGDNYFWCKSIITKNVIRAKDVNVDSLEVRRMIPVEFHIANGIKRTA